MRLKNKQAIVTGAGGGIGRAICLAFAREGAQLVCSDIDKSSLNTTVSLVNEIGGSAVPIIGDVSDNQHSLELVEAAKTTMGGLSSLVSCAIHDVPYLPVTDLPIKAWKDSLDVNLTGVFLMLKHSIPLMVSGGGGSIVLVASQLAFTPKPGRAWYASQKGALISLVKALAVDHAKENVRANTISPGPTNDRRFLSQWPTEKEAHDNAATLFGRLGSPEELAAGAVFLISDESSFVTGTDLLIDGGYTAI
ncbi:MAG: SDR family oxidoreductase [Pseudomonadota bacterium]|nr:SDR family oxidoreductase [Pseudomonadota bacterium]